MNSHTRDTVCDLIKRVVDGEDISGAKELKYLTYFDIAMYAKEMGYKYSIEDIGRNQKVDLIKSIVKRTV